MNSQSNVKKVIGVVSGKGGVGKSSVTSMLAVTAQRKGYKTAVLDADITGPSIPKAFGLTQKALGNEEAILPVLTNTGIKTISVNSLLEDDTDPVVWRGPVLSGVVEQFWNDVIWGDIDVMFVDMPPGTGDVALTVFQSLPLDGIVIVTSPQELVSMIVEKAVKMANMMNVPVVGLVENMSYFVCPDCGKQHNIFGESHIEEIAAKYGITDIAKLPMEPKVAAACDQGLVETLDTTGLLQMAEACMKADNPNKHDGMPKPKGCTGSCSSCGVEGCGSRQ
ncbi:MAG: Mrp/NBP35 family ATP-binding protein [Firmicutes bacterium]|nr:Mrp/NBP35 family ATP-binding protein [Bacillota bacterium]